jgi:hypothetical protein
MEGGRARFKFAEYAADAGGAVTDEADNRSESRFARRCSSFSRWCSVARIAAATTGSCVRVSGAAASGIALRELREVTVVAGVTAERESDDVEDDGEVVPNDDIDDRLVLGLELGLGRYERPVGITEAVSPRAFFIGVR